MEGQMYRVEYTIWRSSQVSQENKLPNYYITNIWITRFTNMLNSRSSPQEDERPQLNPRPLQMQMR